METRNGPERAPAWSWRAAGGGVWGRAPVRGRLRRRAAAVAFSILAIGLGSGLVAAAGGEPMPPEDEGMAGEMTRMIGLMERMTAFQASWHKAVSDPERAIVFAASAVGDLTDGDKGRQAEILRGLLKEVKPLGARNVIRFAIKDALKESGKHAEALEEVRAIVEENAKAVPAAQ